MLKDTQNELPITPIAIEKYITKLSNEKTICMLILA